ncbi:MAG: glycosyltransferase family 10 [Paludibacteraceae bacterium]|nr:glycosyltransferase family 10 [Paludibacteraceae bacterium]
MIQKIIHKYHKYRDLQTNTEQQIRENKGRQIRFYNFWKQSYESMYWKRWFDAHPEILKNSPKVSVGMFSVFGDRLIIDKVACDVNIFYSAENLKNNSFNQYADFCLANQHIGLSMGFEYFDNERYVRFPNWMDVFFLKKDDIKSVCKTLCYPNIKEKNRFAACVCSHDNTIGFPLLRENIIQSFSSISKVSCPGKFRHNDDTLLKDFNDDKMEYLKRFYFNICPENSNAMGYVTEKLFHCISAGCIPIYWGSYNNPEPDVLNKDAIIFWSSDEQKNKASLKLISDLYESPKLMNDFLSQPRLLPTAEEYIYNQMDLIEKCVSSLMKRKD